MIGAAEACGVQELWSLGDMIGRGPDPEHVVARTRDRCTVALMGNHDYGATGAAEPTRFGEPGSPAVRSIELARERLSGPDVEWMRSRKPAARRREVQCWHGGPRNAVHEYVGPSNAAACLASPARRARAGRPHARCGRVAPDAARRERGQAPRRRAAGSRRRQVAAESRRGRCARAVAARLVERSGRPGGRRRVLAPARPGAAYRDVAPRAVRPGTGAPAGARPRPRRRGRATLTGSDSEGNQRARPSTERPLPA